MTVLQALLLGVLQGVTEFFPVSSSGHLVLAETFLNLTIPPEDLLGFDVLLHAATAMALLISYRRQWWEITTSLCRPADKANRRLLWFLILASVPGALAGLLFEDLVSGVLRSVTSVAVALLVTALILLAAHRTRGETTIGNMTVWQALAMGLAQALAIVPGLSRSGLTISAGQLNGLARRDALDFSFLMAMPIILGATALTMFDIASNGAPFPPPASSLTGFAASFVVSWLAIRGLRRFVAQRSLAWFALYLIPAALIILSFSL